MERLAAVIAERTGVPPHANPLYVIVRNLFFLAVVLLHILRRLLPPYR